MFLPAETRCCAGACQLLIVLLQHCGIAGGIKHATAGEGQEMPVDGRNTSGATPKERAPFTANIHKETPEAPKGEEAE
jgi:hypothetical protein